jgi:hypothetical protein
MRQILSMIAYYVLYGMTSFSSLIFHELDVCFAINAPFPTSTAAGSCGKLEQFQKFT